MTELPLPSSPQRSHSLVRRSPGLKLAAICGGGVMGGLAALLASELLINRLSVICTLPLSASQQLTACRAVEVKLPMAPAIVHHFNTHVGWLEQVGALPVQGVPLHPMTRMTEQLPQMPSEMGTTYPFGPPTFTASTRLQTVVAQLAAIAQASEYPVDALSISLVDLSTGEYAGFSDRTPRYPASVIKPFWAIAALAYGKTGPDIEAAITDSDNAASNRLLNGVSHPVMRDYWQAAGFSISAQYPVNVWVSDRPGNRVTTGDLVRLLHDIQSPQGHRRIAQAMRHDIDAERNDGAGAVQGFLGAGLPGGELLTKVGLTSGVRAEMAILSLDDRPYAIAIIGADPTFARSESIFPAFGDLLFQLLSPPPA
jgi:hypothetical protein